MYHRSNYILILIKFLGIGFGIVMFIAIGISYVTETIVFPLVVLFVALLSAVINIKIKGITEYIEFSDKYITVKRRNKFKILLDGLILNKVIVKSYWKGMRISDGNKSVTVWKYEFSNSDWNKITQCLTNRACPGKTLTDYFGFTFINK